MSYMAYLVGFAACLLGIIRAIVAIRWFLWEARAGRVIEGKELLNLALVNASGIFMVGVQILLLAQHGGWISDNGQIPLWPGIAGIILLTISYAWALIERRKENANKPMRQ